MKKSSKPLIFFVVFVLAAFAFLLLAYVGVKLECELLLKEKFQVQEKLQTDKNRQVNLLAQSQYLSSGERIMKIAAEEMNMIRKTDYELTLVVDKEKIEQVDEALRYKYE